jgi:glycosyltransferase involved in cell wall biosynthesis
MNAMVSGLIKAGHQVRVLAINSNKYNVSSDSIPEDYRMKTGINAVYIDLSVKPLHAFLNLFTDKSYHVERFISEDFRHALTTILKEEKFDIIQFETLFTSPYLSLIRQLSDAKVVLRAHNIEHLIWQRIAEGCTNFLKKQYLFHLARTLRKYEIETLKQVDGVAAITEKDAEFFRSIAPETPVTSIPFGISPEETTESVIQIPKTGLPTLFHLGSMNWIPNQEGIRWFLTKVWPDVSTKFPGLKFHIAGREMPGWIKEITLQGVVVDGEVPDAMAYMKSHAIMIVPLFSGSGIRIKIIEGMMAGKAIITTTIGAEGIDGKDGLHFLIADDVAGFKDAVEKCMNMPGLIEELGHQACKLVTQNHNNEKLMQNISDFYLQLR